MTHPALNAPAWQYRTALAPSDVVALRELLERTGVFNSEEVDVAIELAEDALQKREASDYYFVLAEIDDWRSEATTSEQGRAQHARRQGAKPLSANIIGYTCYGRIPFTDARYDLYWIAADPALGRSGVAGALLAHTEALIQSAGGKHIYADTSSRAPYAPAHAFYKKHGYRHVATLKNFYRDGDDKLTFEKII